MSGKYFYPATGRGLRDLRDDLRKEVLHQEGDDPELSDHFGLLYRRFVSRTQSDTANYPHLISEGTRLLERMERERVSAREEKAACEEEERRLKQKGLLRRAHSIQNDVLRRLGSTLNSARLTYEGRIRQFCREVEEAAKVVDEVEVERLEALILDDLSDMKRDHDAEMKMRIEEVGNHRTAQIFGVAR